MGHAGAIYLTLTISIPDFAGDDPQGSARYLEKTWGLPVTLRR